MASGTYNILGSSVNLSHLHAMASPGFHVSTAQPHTAWAQQLTLMTEEDSTTHQLCILHDSEVKTTQIILPSSAIFFRWRLAPLNYIRINFSFVAVLGSRHFLRVFLSQTGSLSGLVRTPHPLFWGQSDLTLISLPPPAQASAST